MKWKRSKKAQQEAKVKDGNQTNSSEVDKGGKHPKNDSQQNAPKNLNGAPANNVTPPNVHIPAMPPIITDREGGITGMDIDRDRSVEVDGRPPERIGQPAVAGFSPRNPGNSRRLVGLGGIQGDPVRGNGGSPMDMFRPYVV